MNFRKKTIFAIILFITYIYGDKPEKIDRFNTITFENQTILQDNYTKLEWVNGVDGNISNEDNITIDDGCISFNVTSENNNIIIRKKAESYCKALKFASYSDWRVPKDIEYKELILAVKESNLSIYYDSPLCINAIGLDKNILNIISTNLEDNSTGNITIFKKNNITTCLRCVRDGEEPLAP